MEREPGTFVLEVGDSEQCGGDSEKLMATNGEWKLEVTVVWHCR